MTLAEPNFAAARRHMVLSQLRPNKVTDERVVSAIDAVPRELFVPAAFRGVAYMDDDVSIGSGRYLMEPMVFARLLQFADIGPSDRVLEIGSGTGYGAAVLSHLCSDVTALESDPSLARSAEQLLPPLAAGRVALVKGDLTAGAPGKGPFDVILLAGAIEQLPPAIGAQLATGGRILGVIRERGIGRASMWQRAGSLLARRSLFDAATPLLPGFGIATGFTF